MAEGQQANAVASDLIEKARMLFLGGKPCAPITKDKRMQRDINSADILLSKAEHIMGGESMYSETLFTRKDDENTGFLLNVINAAILRCQIAGQNNDFELVLKVAKTAIKAIEKPPANEHDDSKTAALFGYQGFALVKLGRYDDAILPLEKSVEINKRKTQKKRSSVSEDVAGPTITYAERRERRERVAVRNTLRECYKQTGTVPPPPDLIKFPRTSHLFDAGGTAATSDDLVMSCDDAMFQLIGDGSTQVIIEEKVDGANLGISLCPMSGKILVQNRSHYISKGEHAQFSQITEWTSLHRLALVGILSGGSSSFKKNDGNQIGYQSKLILYGEWVVARHSIPYQRLPGYFVAFDLFDVDSNRFYSRERFHSIMKGSGIPVVPVIKVCKFPSDNPQSSAKKKQFASLQSEFKKLLDTPSQFRNDGGTVEGIVLRIDDGFVGGHDINHHTLNGTKAPTSQWLLYRSKLVRPDFIRGCADGHWMTRSVEKQRLDFEFADEYIERCYVFASSNGLDREESGCEDNFDQNRKISGDEKGGSSESQIGEGSAVLMENDVAPASQNSLHDFSSNVAKAAPASSMHPNTPEKEVHDSSSMEEKMGSCQTQKKSNAKVEKKNTQKMREQEIEKARLRRRAPRIIMLCGLPGAGKSTFTARLNQSSDAPTETNSSSKTVPVHWTVINQDKLGRKECVALAGRACRNKGRIIFDRCNLTQAERRDWMDVVHNPPKGETALVYIATSADTCVARVQNRINHETIPHGRGEGIVRKLEKQIEPPTPEEKQLFGTVEILTSVEEVDHLLIRWGA